MEMKKINSGKLRAIGYDARARLLQVQLDDSSMLQYSGVGEKSGAALELMWARLETIHHPIFFETDTSQCQFSDAATFSLPACLTPSSQKQGAKIRREEELAGR